MLNSFHFLRPWWFLALIPAIIIFVFGLKKIKSGKNNWAKYCDPHLLPHLISNNYNATKAWLPHLLLIIWLLSTVALAGPTWSLYAQNVYQKNVARVIALDVSLSMNATDLEPSRMERAKYKVLDLLHAVKEGQTGMIVFSSSSFLVSPLTSDNNTIASMVPVLNSNIVPVQGSDIKQALQKSAKLLKQAGFTQGEIIVVTDSSPSEEAIDEANKLQKDGYTVSVWAIGTAQEVPLTDPHGNVATNNNGNAIITKLDSAGLEKLAKNGNGTYVNFSNDNSDVEQILDKVNVNGLNTKPSKEMTTKSLWKDEGHWLVWLIIILCAFIARKGWLEKLC